MLERGANELLKVVRRLFFPFSFFVLQVTCIDEKRLNHAFPKKN